MIQEHLKKIIVIAIIAVGIGYFTLSDETKPMAHEASDEAIKPPVKKVTHPTLAAVATGTIDVEGGIGNISANLSGIIKEVFVKEGDQVEIGHVLATQEDAAETIALDEALNSLETQNAQMELHDRQTVTATRDLERIKPLYEIGAITSIEFDRANDRVFDLAINKKIKEANLVRTQNNIKKAQFNLEQRKIKAPMAGRIVTIAATPGAGASTMNVTTLFTIIPNTAYIVKAKVAGSMYKDLYVGQKATVTSDYDKETKYDAVVTRVGQYFPIKKEQSNSRNTQQQQLDVTLSLDDKTLLIGQKVQIRLLRKQPADTGAK